MRNTITLVLMLLFEALPANGSWAANPPTGAELAGSITDPQGRAVPNASVTLLALDREAAPKTATDQQGHYEFHGIVPGNYKLKVNVAGFNAVDQPLSAPANN